MNTTSHFFALLFCSLLPSMPLMAGSFLSKKGKIEGKIAGSSRTSKQPSDHGTYTGPLTRKNTFSPTPPSSRSEESRSDKTAAVTTQQQ